jgi:hypothetical protein
MSNTQKFMHIINAKSGMGLFIKKYLTQKFIAQKIDTYDIFLQEHAFPHLSQFQCLFHINVVISILHTPVQLPRLRRELNTCAMGNYIRFCKFRPRAKTSDSTFYDYTYLPQKSSTDWIGGIFIVSLSESLSVSMLFIERSKVCSELNWLHKNQVDHVELTTSRAQLRMWKWALLS